MPTTRTAIVVAGGAALPLLALADLPPDAYIIAADSGLDDALAANLRPSRVVGDLDSVSDDALSWARREGVPIDEFSPDKDATDTELALAVALDIGAEHLILLGGGGDRLDHSIGAITALGHPALAAFVSVTARWGTSLVHVIHGPRATSLQVQPHSTFSLLALHGACHSVGLQGAKWPLVDATLVPASCLGVSNETVASELHVEVHSGILTVVFPYQFGGQS